MKNEKFGKILDSLIRVDLYKYEREENPGKESIRLFPKLQFRLEAEDKLREIKSLFKIQKVTDDSLRTAGDYYFEFKSKDGQAARVEYLMRGRIRSEELWSNDAILMEPLSLLKWLASMGVNQPLQNEIRIQERYQKERQKNEMIYSKIPSILLKADGKLDMSNMRKDSKVLYEELISQNPNQKTNLVSLFELLVLRSNNWWETSVLEMLITKVILGIPIKSVEQIIESGELTLPQADGIGRFFTSEEFQRYSVQEGIVVSQASIQIVFKLLLKIGNEKKIRIFESKMLEK